MKALIARAERVLRWSEKYMKTDMVYLAKGGFWLTLGQIASMATGLLLVIGFANLLPKETYGNYKLILSLAGIISAFTLTGMDVAITQAVARGADGAFRTGFKIQLRWSVFIVLAAAIAAAYYFSAGEGAIAVSLLIAGAFSPVIESTSLYAAFLNGKKDFRTGSLYGIIRSLVPVLVLLTAILFTEDLILIVLAYFLSHAATGLALYLRTVAKYKPRKEDDLSNVEYSKHVSVLNLVSIVASSIDKILIFHFLGAIQLAAYGIAFSIPAQLKVVIKMVNSLAFPKLSSATHASIRSAIDQKALKLFFGFGAVIAIYVVAAPLIFRLIFPQYIEAVLLSQALALGYLFSPTQLYSQALYAQKRQKDIYTLKISTAAARILLLIILLPPFGVWGAVYAFFLANAASGAMSVVLFKRLKE